MWRGGWRTLVNIIGDVSDHELREVVNHEAGVQGILGFAMYDGVREGGYGSRIDKLKKQVKTVAETSQ